MEPILFSIMELVGSSMKFVIPLILIFISIRSKDPSVTQITGIVGMIIFFCSFFIMPVLIKLAIIGILGLAWLLVGDSIVLYFHRLFSK